MKNNLNFESDIKNLESELEKLKDHYNQGGLSEVDTNKISKTQDELDKKLKEIYSNFKELNFISDVLLNRLPLKMSGVHDICFSEYNTTLTLVYDDFSSVKNFSFLADAWYLDGFAPKKNLSAWTEDILKNVYRDSNVHKKINCRTSNQRCRSDG